MRLREGDSGLKKERAREGEIDRGGYKNGRMTKREMGGRERERERERGERE